MKNRIHTDWPSVIDTYNKSGLTPREFARANQIHPDTLRYHLKRVGQPTTRRKREPSFIQLPVATPQVKIPEITVTPEINGVTIKVRWSI